MSQHVPDNPYPDEKDTTVYQIGHGSSILFIICFALLVMVPVLMDHLQRHSHEVNGEKHAKRRAFFYEVFSPPSFDPDTSKPADKRIVHHLRWLERGLDEAGYAASLRQDIQQNVSTLFQEGNRKVFYGFGDWLFYQPDIRALTGYGPLKPEPFSVMKDPELAQQPAAGDCIRAFAAQLKERGIQLLFVPLPLKPMLYNEEIAPASVQEFLPDRPSPYAKPRPRKPLAHPDQQAFYDALKREGIDVMDNLATEFAYLRTDPKHLHYIEATSENREIARQSEENLQLRKDAFLKQDTHWTVDAMERTAELVAAHVKQKYPDAMRPMARTIVSRDGDFRESMGDMVKMLDLKEPEQLFEPEVAALRFVEDTLDEHAPIVLLGDSFVNIFDDPSIGFANPNNPQDRVKAGFAQRLSLKLNQPLDVIAMNGKGATGVRQELARRHDDKVRAKKLVIWVIAARDVLLSRTAAKEANIEWNYVQFNPNRSADASDPIPGTVSAQVIVEATLSEKSKNQEVTGTPYRDALHTATYDITRVVEGKLEAKQVIGVQWTFKDKVMQPTASFQVGKRYRLTLVPWDTKADLKLLNLQDDSTAFDAERWFVEKAEPLP